jgi:hypothetical protein
VLMPGLPYRNGWMMDDGFCVLMPGGPYRIGRVNGWENL